MEWLTIVLAGLLTAISPVGLILDKVIADTLRNQVQSAETIAVRVDNVPSYSVLQGKLDRLRVASRNIEPIENVKIAVLEVETDPLDIDINQLDQGLREALRKPLQGAVRLVMTEADINQAFASDQVKSQIQAIIDDILPESASRFELSNLRLELLPENRLQLDLNLQQAQTNDPLDLALAVQLKIVDGRSLQLSDLEGSINGRRLSSRLLNSFVQGSRGRLDLRSLEKKGIFVRILQFETTDDQMHLAVFGRLDPLPSTATLEEHEDELTTSTQ